MALSLNQSEFEAVAEAIRKAELRTSAEIYCVLAERSSRYHFVGMAFSSLSIMLGGLLAFYWLQWQGYTLRAELVLWTQLIAFLAVYALLLVFPKLATFIAPMSIKQDRAHANAVKQFMAHGIHYTKGRNGVLIFVSLEERFAEIMVDSAIEEKLGRDFFLSEVAHLVDHCRSGEITDGYRHVIENVADRLETAFPYEIGDINELQDRLILL